MATVAITLDVDTASGTAKLREFGGEMGKTGEKATGAQSILSNVFQGMGMGVGVEVASKFFDILKGGFSALPSMISTAADYAGNLLKMEAAYGLTAKAQQVLMLAGKDVGVSWESQLTSIKKMQTELEKSPESLAKLGLKYADIKNLAPEKQYEAIGKAIAGIEDPTKRSTMAAQFFGKTGAESLAIFDGAIAVASEDVEKFALTMDKNAAESVDRLGDNIDKGGTAFEGMSRNIVAAIASSEPFQMLIEGILEVVGWLSREIKTNQDTIKQWVSIGVIAALNAIMMLTPAIGWAIDGFAGLQISLAATIKGFQDAAAFAVYLANVIKSPIQATKALFASLAQNQAEAAASTANAMATNAQWRAGLATGQTTLSNFIDKVEASAGASKVAEDATKRHGTEISEAGKATSQAAKEWQTFVDKVGGADLTKKLDQYSKAIAQGIKLTPEATKELSETIDKAIAAGIKVSDPALTQMAAEFRGKQAAKALSDEVEKAMKNLPKSPDIWKFLETPTGVGKTLEKELKEAERAVDDVQKAFDRGGMSVKDYAAEMLALGKPLDAATLKQLEFNEKLDRLADKAALIGSIGDLFEGLGLRGAKALQSVSDGMGRGISAAQQYATAQNAAQRAMVLVETASYAMKEGVLAGAAAGATFASASGFGLVGTVVGAAAGALFGWIGKAQRAREEAAKLTAEIEKQRSAYIANAGGLEQLQSQAAATGLTLDRLFKASTVKEYEAAVKELNDAFDMQKKANQALDEAMQRYGITIEQLGPKFSQQRLDEQAMALLKDYELLIAAGVENNLVLEKMSPAMQEYIEKVVAAGGTVPESMRKIIEQMIKLGLLTDAAGNAIDSIDKINFAPTVSEAIVSMTKAIERLIAALLGIPSDVHTNFSSSRTGPGPWGGPGDDNTDDGPGGNPPAMARGGIVMPRPGGLLARVAEAGEPELVAPVRAFSRQLAGDLSRSVPTSASAGDIYILIAPSTGEARQLSPAEARRIEGAMGSGLIKVPRRAITA